MTRQEIVEKVLREREEQDRIWGQQDHHPVEWMAILMEEVGEALYNRKIYHIGQDEKDGLFED